MLSLLISLLLLILLLSLSDKILLRRFVTCQLSVIFLLIASLSMEWNSQQ